MPEFGDVLDLAQGGAIAILLFQNFQLWKRLNELTDSFLSYLDKRAALGDTAAQRTRSNGDGKH